MTARAVGDAASSGRCGLRPDSLAERWHDASIDRPTPGISHGRRLRNPGYRGPSRAFRLIAARTSRAPARRRRRRASPPPPPRVSEGARLGRDGDQPADSGARVPAAGGRDPGGAGRHGPAPGRPARVGGSLHGGADAAAHVAASQPDVVIVGRTISRGPATACPTNLHAQGQRAIRFGTRTWMTTWSACPPSRPCTTGPSTLLR